MAASDSERYGSLLMAADDLPKDRHGHPYQVILVLLPGGGTADLRRDEEGRAFSWVRDEQAQPTAGADGEPLTEPVPAEVQAEAERWLAQQQDPEFQPTPGGNLAIGSSAPTAAPNSTRKLPSLASPARA